MSALGVSTWSLHNLLGRMYPGLDMRQGVRQANDRFGPGRVTLLEIPAIAADLGITHLDICHFHFPQTDAPYLHEFRATLSAAGITSATLLIDEGDIAAADPVARQHDLEAIKAWLDVAATIGAGRARVIAGKSTDQGALDRSIAGLKDLSAYATMQGVEVITENWLALASTPENLLSIVNGLDGNLNLCADFGNYKGAGKYDALQSILPHAVTIHAKADFSSSDQMDRADFTRCLDLSRDARFSGPYVLIFEGSGDERSHLAQMVTVVQPYL